MQTFDDCAAIRAVMDAYAHCADTRDAAGQMARFTVDTHFVVFMDSQDPEPTQELHRREDLAPMFDALNRYVETMHFNGQSTIVVDGDGATGELYCLAHHLTVADGKRSLMIAAIRYLDSFVRAEGGWLFSERKLYVKWIENRALT